MRGRVLALGFTDAEFGQLRRISMTLHRWHELECGTGDGKVTRSIERDEATGKPFLRIQRSTSFGWLDNRFPTPDKETGALKRLAKLMTGRDGLISYVQGDPRGAALYLVPASELRGQPIESVYSRGVCIY